MSEAEIIVAMRCCADADCMHCPAQEEQDQAVCGCDEKLLLLAAIRRREG